VTTESFDRGAGDLRRSGRPRLFEHASMGRHDPSGFVDWGNERR